MTNTSNKYLEKVAQMEKFSANKFERVARSAYESAVEHGDKSLYSKLLGKYTNLEEVSKSLPQKSPRDKMGVLNHMSNLRARAMAAYKNMRPNAEVAADKTGHLVPSVNSLTFSRRITSPSVQQFQPFQSFRGYSAA